MSERGAEAILCNCWYRPDGTRIGYTVADGCQAHPDDQVTDERVWGPMPVSDPKPGKLAPPYPRPNCASATCGKTLSPETGGAYLFKDREGDKLVIFCEDCAAYVELNARQRFGLVEL